MIVAIAQFSLHSQNNGLINIQPKDDFALYTREVQKILSPTIIRGLC